MTIVDTCRAFFQRQRSSISPPPQYDHDRPHDCPQTTPSLHSNGQRSAPSRHSNSLLHLFWESLYVTVTELCCAITHIINMVRWAPLSIPFERRMQTATVFFFYLLIPLGWLYVMSWMVLCPIVWPFTVFYFVFIMMDSVRALPLFKKCCAMFKM